LWDDNNPVWEDIDDQDDNELEAEARWRQDDIMNGYDGKVPPEADDENTRRVKGIHAVTRVSY
jgi:hypothetical protein